MGESNRGQALAANPAAIGENRASGLAGITAQKSVLPLTAALGGLILAFHIWFSGNCSQDS
jgi:hypothetical protein